MLFCPFWVAIEARGEAQDTTERDPKDPAATGAKADVGDGLTPFARFSQGVGSANPEDRYVAMLQLLPRALQQDERPEAVRLLTHQLDDELPDLRWVAANSLIFFGHDAKPAMSQLVKHLGDQGINQELGAVWHPVSEALGAIGPDAVQPLLDALTGCDRVTYYAIMNGLSEIGEAAAATATPVLLEQLRSGPENQRWATMYALTKMGDAAKPAIPDYIEQLDHQDFNMQVMACRALAELGPASKAAVPKLLELIDKGILSSRTHAAMCLGAIGPVEGVDSVGILMKLAQEKNAFCQERAMIALGRFGRQAAAAEPLILELIERDDFTQQPEAALALWQVTGDGERSARMMLRWIDSPTYDGRVLTALAAMGPAASSVVDELTKKVDDEDQGIRLLAVKALRAMGPAAAGSVDVLRARLADSDRDVVYAIDQAIASIQQGN